MGKILLEFLSRNARGCSWNNKNRKYVEETRFRSTFQSLVVVNVFISGAMPNVRPTATEFPLELVALEGWYSYRWSSPLFPPIFPHWIIRLRHNYSITLKVFDYIFSWVSGREISQHNVNFIHLAGVDFFLVFFKFFFFAIYNCTQNNNTPSYLSNRIKSDWLFNFHESPGWEKRSA